MTTEEGRAWKARWKEVNEFQRQEARRRTTEQRLRDVAFMLRLGKNWPRSEAQLNREQREIEEVRSRWAKLRKAFGA